MLSCLASVVASPVVIALARVPGARRVDPPPFGGHVHQRPAVLLCLIQGLVQAPDLGLAVVGPLARCVGVVHQGHEPLATAGGGPLQHLQVAVGVAESQQRAPADDPVDAFRLARAVVVVGQLGGAQDRRLAVLELPLGDEVAADHLFRRDAVGAFGEGAHEGGVAAGDDVGLEILAAQVVEHFQHGLVDHLVERPPGLRVAGLGQPAPGIVDKGLAADAGMGGADDLQQAVHAAGGQDLVITFEHGLERLAGLPLGVLGRQALDFVEGEQHLEIGRLLAPQGAVVVEHGNALGGFHVVRAALGGHRLDEGENALLARAVLPRGQGVAVGQGQQRGGQQQQQEGQVAHAPGGWKCHGKSFS
ncbi:hypothetical protein PBOI14_36000 [Pseudomonas sp. Boi14]|nr:hypothetical protein PBOI14_36000 [Pseudomonas sp. Boi14]